MIAPRKPPPSRLLRVRWRPLPASRGLRRRSPRGGGGWLPVGLRWRRLARPVPGAPAPLAPRAGDHRQRERHPAWRVRTVMLPAAPAAGRLDASRGLRGMRGAAGAAQRGEAARHGGMTYRIGLAAPSRSSRYLPAQSPLLARHLPCVPRAAAITETAPARLEWMRRSPLTSPPTPAPQRARGLTAASLQQRAPTPAEVRWRLRAAAPVPAPAPALASTSISGASSLARGPALPPGGESPRDKVIAIHNHARIDWRVRNSGAIAASPAGAATVQALARRAELVWRTAAASAETGIVATPGAAQRRATPGERADKPVSGMPSPATFTAAASAAPPMLDAATTERLVEDVLRRAEQRMRIERERRGL